MMDMAMLISKTSVGGTFYTRLSLATKSKRYDSVNLMEVPNNGPILRFKKIYLEAKNASREISVGLYEESRDI